MDSVKCVCGIRSEVNWLSQNVIIANNTGCFTNVFISMFQEPNPRNATWHAEFTEVGITDLEISSSRHYNCLPKVGDISISRWLYCTSNRPRRITLRTVRFLPAQERNVSYLLLWLSCPERFPFVSQKDFLNEFLSVERPPFDHVLRHVNQVHALL
jgi:hypothetical protein